MCRGTTVRCRECRKSEIFYRERCSQAELDLYPGSFHRIIGRLRFRRRCGLCRAARQAETQREHRNFQQNVERAKFLLEFFRGEHPAPVPEAEVRQRLDHEYWMRNRLHPFIEGDSTIAHFRVELADRPEALQGFNATIERQQDIDRNYRPLTEEDRTFRWRDPCTCGECYYSDGGDSNPEIPEPSTPEPPVEQEFNSGPMQPASEPAQENYRQPVDFREWTIDNNGAAMAWRELTTIMDQPAPLTEYISDTSALRRDIDGYSRYLLSFGEDEHIHFLEVMQELFAYEEQHWSFVPSVTRELDTQLMDFREWLVNNDQEVWGDCHDRYRQYLEREGTPPHLASFLDACERLARNQRRMLTVRFGGPIETLEPGPWEEGPDHSSGCEQENDAIDTSSQHQPDESPMAFQEWGVVQSPSIGTDLTLFPLEALGQDTDAYEHEYLGQHPNSALMLMDFRNLRRQIQENEQANYDFVPPNEAMLTLREFLRFSSLDLNERNNWLQELRNYSRFLERIGAEDMLLAFREALCQQARADRQRYENGLQEDHPQEAQRQEVQTQQAVPQLHQLCTNSATIIRTMMNANATHPRREEILAHLAPVLGAIEHWRLDACNHTDEQHSSTRSRLAQVLELIRDPVSLVPTPTLEPIINSNNQDETPDPDEERAQARREERDTHLQNALVYVRYVASMNRDHPDVTVRALGRQAIEEVLYFIQSLLRSTRIPSLEQWQWIDDTIENAERVLQGWLSVDDLDIGGAPADEDDIMGSVEREDRRVVSTIRERRE